MSAGWCQREYTASRGEALVLALPESVRINGRPSEEPQPKPTVAALTEEEVVPEDGVASTGGELERLERGGAGVLRSPHRG